MPTVATTKPDLTKQEAILHQSVHVFARQGFRGTDVQEIADRAGVGKGTVYRYFGDKQALFWATAYWVLEQLHSRLKDATDPADGALNKLSASCRTYAKFFAENPDYLEVFVLDRAEFRGRAPEHHQELHEQMIREFTEIIEQGMASGEVRRDDPRKIVWTLGSTLYGSVVFAAFSKQEQSITELAAHATEIFLRGIATASDQEGTAT
ncbi:MAG: TetR/AcrR family transcriptional regulator [Planctomycetes bacterium]|nr:TetR/AcrR family transcriptional regulator [Planctomycetota bacterium]